MTTTNSDVSIRQKRNSKLGPPVRKQYDRVWNRMAVRNRKASKTKRK